MYYTLSNPYYALDVYKRQALCDPFGIQGRQCRRHYASYPIITPGLISTQAELTGGLKSTPYDLMSFAHVTIPLHMCHKKPLERKKTIYAPAFLHFCSAVTIS